MYRNLALPAAVLVLCTAVSARADNHVLGQMYGSGVHAYFSAESSANPLQAQNGYVKAHRHLTTAIDGGTRDPRAYYYRGLAYVKLGRDVEANVDFEKGAELECGDLNKIYNVGRSLERVQGATRMMLEEHRVKARMAALAEADRVHKARYEQIRREENRVLQEQVDSAPQAPAEMQPPEAPAPANDDPFAVGPQDKQPPAETVEPPPGEPVEPPAEKPAEKPADVTAAPAGEKKPGGVFGAMGRALGKAVGSGGDGGGEAPAPKPETAPADDNPFSPEPEKPADDDPFSAPAAPAGGTPAVDPSNPFA